MGWGLGFGVWGLVYVTLFDNRRTRYEQARKSRAAAVRSGKFSLKNAYCWSLKSTLRPNIQPFRRPLSGLEFGALNSLDISNTTLNAK